MELIATIRDKVGKGLKNLRREGFIPAELYGRGLENVHLMVSAKDFRLAFKSVGENAVLTLVVGKKKHSVLVNDVQRDALEGEIVHVDFYEVRMDEKISTRVPLEFVGEAPAVKAGGIVNKSMSELAVEALPGDLPHRLTVDLSVLRDMEQSIYVKDIVLPKGVTATVDPDTVVATVTERMAEEVAPPAPVDVAEVKVESEEKKAEREKEKAADAS